MRDQRASAQAETAAALLELAYRMDVRPLLEQVRAPTVVVHRRADRAIPYACGRDLAGSIPGARLVSVDGDAHLPWVGDWMSVSRALGSFLTGDPARPTPPRPCCCRDASARSSRSSPAG